MFIAAPFITAWKQLKYPMEDEWRKMSMSFWTLKSHQLVRIRWNYEELSFPGGTSGKEPACQHGRLRLTFNPWVGKDPLEEGIATTPVLWPEESHGQWSLGSYGPQSCKELDTTEQLNWTEKLCLLGLSTISCLSSLTFRISTRWLNNLELCWIWEPW